MQVINITNIKFHPWRCDRTDCKLGNKKPNLCEAEKRRFEVKSHQEGRGMALAHCCAENGSVIKIETGLTHIPHETTMIYP